MPTLAQLLSGATDPTLVQTTPHSPMVEPLDGPTTVDDVMDRFSEEIYQQGRDTHLYRLLTALSGDAGAGLVKAQAFAARLKFEAEFLNFQVLDDYYGVQFRFKRLKTETYPNYNPNTDALTPTVWDAIQFADQSYRQRVADFFTATRYGTSPSGMALAAQAGSGVECEIVENYRWIFDQFSDDILGIVGIGTTASTSEFIIVPRLINSAESALGYAQPRSRAFARTAAVLNNTLRPSTGGTGPTVTPSITTTGFVTAMVPEVERNMLDIIDRLRPTGSVASVLPEQTKYTTVAISGNAHASSERLHVSRLVEGNASVAWPNLDASKNYFIQAGIEKETGYFFGSARELPVIFQTVESARAYTEAAQSDLLYGTGAFYDASSGISAYEKYRSEAHGLFSAPLVALFPFLSNVAPDTAFGASSAIAINNTPLALEGQVV